MSEQNKNQTTEAIELRAALEGKDAAAQADQRATGTVRAYIITMYSNGWTKVEIESAAGWTEDNASEADKATAKRFVQYAREVTSRLSNEEREEIAEAVDTPVADLEEAIGVKGTKKATETSLNEWQVKEVDHWEAIGEDLMRGKYVARPKCIEEFIAEDQWLKLTNQKVDPKTKIGEDNQGMEKAAADGIINQFHVTRHIDLAPAAKKIREEKAEAAKTARLEDRIRTATENVPLANLKVSAKAEEEITLPKKATRESIVDALATNARIQTEFEKPSESGLARDWKAAAKAAKAEAKK